jgi:hypothetical protein
VSDISKLDGGLHLIRPAPLGMGAMFLSSPKDSGLDAFGEGFTQLFTPPATAKHLGSPPHRCSVRKNQVQYPIDGATAHSCTMANAITTNHSAGGLLTLFASTDGQDKPWLTNTTALVATTIVLALLLPWLWTPKLDPREPQLVKPTIPLLGHIIGLIQHQAKYHLILQ